MTLAQSFTSFSGYTMARTAVQQLQLAKSSLLFLKRIAFFLNLAWLKLTSRLRSAKVFIYHLDPALARKCEAVAYSLNQHGIPAVVVSNLSRPSRLLLAAVPDLWIGLWNSVPLTQLPKKFIFWNGEPTTHRAWKNEDDWASDLEATSLPRWHENADLRRDWIEAARHSQTVWGYTRSCEAFAKLAEKSFSYVPFGYSPYYEQVFTKVTLGQPPCQDIDVLFYGWTTARRRVVLDELQALRVKVLVINEQCPVRGVDLERLIARSKIVLGIFGYDDEHTHLPDFARFDFVFSNRIFSLHEKLSSACRDEDFEAHVPVCAHRGMASECVRYLADDALRASLAQRTYDWFKSRYALDNHIPFDAVRTML
jgi:hypothetical protein